jgi:hypothetical protein
MIIIEGRAHAADREVVEIIFHLRQRVAELETALDKYAKHDMDCSHSHDECTCGLAALWREG